MKNEQKHLARCLDSVRGLVNEIIIVDTGSTDSSVNIAKRYKAKILFEAWHDDFASPRNLGIRSATCDYVLILDPDEMLLKSDFNKLRNLTKDKKHKAFQLVTKNYGRNHMELGFRTLAEALDPTGKYTGYVPSTKTRFFKNGLGIVFEGIWHELADYYIQRNKIPVRKADVFVHHWFHELNQSSKEAKVKFYLRLGEKKIKLWPRSGQAHWELAVSEAIAGYRYRARENLHKAFSLGFGSANQYFTLSRIERMIGNKGKSDLAMEKAICLLYPNLTHYDKTRHGLAPLLS